MTTTIAALDLPFDEAIAFLRAKTNVTSEGWTDVWGRANARAFTVAGANKQALVEDFRREVASALESGTSLQDFRKQFDAIVKKHGWTHTGKPGWRSRIIYETNLSMAYAAGRYAQQTEPETLAAFPFWQYVHSGALHPRKQHLAWNGMTLRADDPFWTYAYPPNGWRCGCRVRPLSARGLARTGRDGPDPSPQRERITYVDRKTGEIRPATAGIDPGFDYNPGLEWQRSPASLPGASPAAPAPAPTPTPPAPRVPAAPPVRAPAPIAAEPPRPVVPATAEELEADYADWARGLRPEEADALRQYKGSLYRLMNNHLRGLDPFPSVAPVNATLDRALARAKTVRDVVVWRGVRATDPIRKAKVGTIVRDRGFFSTTTRRSVAELFGDGKELVIEIIVRKGYAGAAFVHPYPEPDHDEDEFLFRAGSRFRVLDRSEGRILMEAINEPRRRARLTPGPARRRR